MTILLTILSWIGGLFILSMGVLGLVVTFHHWKRPTIPPQTEAQRRRLTGMRTHGDEMDRRLRK